jgi:hypothetical protein
VFVASVNLSICTNKSCFHNYFYTYPLFFWHRNQKFSQILLSLCFVHHFFCFHCF